MNRTPLILLALALLLAACQRNAPQPAPIDPTMLTTTPLPTIVVTLVPAPTETSMLTPAPTSTHTQEPLPPTPTAAATETSSLPTLEPTPLALPAPRSTPFHDCAVTPGAVGCAQGLAAQAALPGMLAFGNRVMDLSTGTGWEIPAPVSWLDWSPRGDQLLVESGGEGGTVYYLYRRDGTPVGELPHAERPHWGLDNRLALATSVHAEDGREAFLEYTPDLRWLLHLRPMTATGPSTEVSTATLEAQPTDRLYDLVAWWPGTEVLVAQNYVAGNAAMMFGGQVVLIDTASGQVQGLEVEAPMGDDEVFVFNPAATTLAFLDSAGGARRLALYDLAARQLSQPLPEEVMIGDLAWSADGTKLAFSVLEIGPGLPANLAQTINSPGIFWLDLNSGQIQRLTQPPQGELDGFPTFPPGGEWFLYARADSAGQSATVYAWRLSDGQERPLVTGVPLWPQPGALALPWQRSLDYAHP